MCTLKQDGAQEGLGSTASYQQKLVKRPKTRSCRVCKRWQSNEVPPKTITYESHEPAGSVAIVTLNAGV